MHAIPSALKDSPRWVVWKSETRGEGKPTKVPYRADGRGKASSTDPSTWSTFAAASKAAPNYSGLGFVLGDGFAGIDLDGCRDPESGKITDAAAQIVADFNTYTEVSPSGTGVKLFFLGRKPPGVGSAKPGADFKQIEVYDSGRYFAVTGAVFVGTGVEDRAEQLTALCRELWPAPAAATYTRPSDAAVTADARTLARAEQYLDKIPPAIDGQKGHAQTYAAATCMVHGFGLSEAEAMRLLLTRYNDRCQPPWTEKELLHKVSDAASKPHSKPYGWLRDQRGAVEWSKEITQSELDALGWMPGDPEPRPSGDGAVSTATKTTTAPSPPESLPARGGVSNVLVGWKNTDDGPVQVLSYRRIADISAALIGATRGWPKCANGLLFGVRESPPGFLPGPGNVRYFGQPVDLWAWVAETVDPFWSRAAKVSDADGHPRTPATKEEFHRHLRDCAAQRFTHVAYLPHHPPMAGVYYLPCDLPTATGKRLAEFLAMLNPETEFDRQLMLLAMLTPLWGGGYGQRPAFVFDSSHGQGSGKTQTAETIAAIFGGAFRINPREDWETVTKRLMSDRAMAQRVILYDNVKSKLAGQEFEGLITGKEISGWRPFHGNYSRPNDLTVFITSNTARGSKDIASRAVTIHIGPPRPGVVFGGTAFVEEYRAELVADLIAVLAVIKGKVSDENRDRFGEWQSGVLCCLPDADALAELIRERRTELDSDSEEAEEIAAAIQAWVSKENPASNSDGRRRITRDQMRGLLLAAKIVPEDMGKRGVYGWLCNMLGTHGPLAQLADDRSSADGGRVWLWTEKHDIPV